MSASPIYVVVCQNDKPQGDWGVDEHGPLVHETYLKHATLEQAQERASRMERFGACRVARLVFEDEPGFSA